MLMDKINLADIYHGNERKYELVQIDEAKEFVKQKREEEGGIAWAIEEVDVGIYEVEYIIKDNMYGDIHCLNREDFDDLRVHRNSVKVRSPDKWGNPSDGEKLMVASFKRYQGKPRTCIPANKIPKKIN